MKVKITENILIEGQHTEADTIVDLPDDQAKTLILMKRATADLGDPEDDDFGDDPDH